MGAVSSQEIEIARVGAQGEGIADVDGRELRVAGAFVSERVRAQITARSRQRPVDHGMVREVLRAHPGRREPPCPRFGRTPGRCGGCGLLELNEDAQREHLRALLEGLGLPVDAVVAAPEPWAYRRASKRVAFTKARAITLGSWSPRTHDGASMRGCPVEHPRITRIFDELEDTARAQGVPAYDEASGEGVLRYAWAKLDGERAVLTLITASGEVSALAEALQEPDVIAWSEQPHRTNAIRGGAATILRGAPDVDALGFHQPNPAAIAQAMDDLLDGAEGDRAWDLYAGAGAITAQLRSRFEEVVPCERFEESARALGVAPQDVADFLAAREAAPGFVVANPPRKGLGAAVCAELARLRPARLHVMSCGPVGLARDRERLLAAGFTERSLTAYQSLPQTAHVELVWKLES